MNQRTDEEVEPPIPLLPCPFCGNRAELNRLGGKGSTHGWVQCVQCLAELPFSTTFEQACTNWNRRSA